MSESHRAKPERRGDKCRSVTAPVTPQLFRSTTRMASVSRVAAAAMSVSFGESDTGRGVMGISNGNLGVSGESQLFPGVRGHSVNGRGTEGFSDTLEGVVGISKQSTRRTRDQRRRR